jgi:hypothetical protein
MVSQSRRPLAERVEDIGEKFHFFIIYFLFNLNLNLFANCE